MEKHRLSIKGHRLCLYHLLWSQKNLGSSSVTTEIMKCGEYIIPEKWYSIWLKGKSDCYGNVKVMSIYILLAGLPLSSILSAGFTPDFVWLCAKCTVSVHQQIKIKTALTSALYYYSKVGFKTWGGLSGFSFCFVPMVLSYKLTMACKTTWNLNVGWIECQRWTAGLLNQPLLLLRSTVGCLVVNQSPPLTMTTPGHSNERVPFI